MMDPGYVSKANSSTTNLTAGASFTGTAEDVHQFSTITVYVDTDNNATLKMQFSSDGVNWDRTKQVPIDQEISSGSVHTLEVVANFFRVVLTNDGADTTTYLRLQTIYHVQRSGFLTSSPDQKISKINDAQIVRVANDPFFDLSRGLYSDKQAIHKFGANEAIPAGERDIWEYGATTAGDVDYPWPDTTETVTVVSSSANDDGNPTTNTGAQSVTIEGLDDSWAEVSETVTLQGTSPVTTTQTFRRVNRAYVATVGTYTGANEGNLTFTHTTSGDVVAYIVVGVGQTQLSTYSVPANYTAYLRHAHGSVSAGANKEATLKMYRRLNGDDITQPYTGAKRKVHQWPDLNGIAELDFYAMPSFGPKSDLWWTSQGNAGSSVSIVYDLILVKNDSPTSPQ